jgi:protein phosphatase/serine/threonine-protein phosphatase Stp1
MRVLPIQTKWHALTDVGAVRSINEDRYHASDDAGLWVVADGMGGMSRGDWAAAQVVECLAAVGRQEDLQGMLADTSAALRRANDQILRESEERGEQMGTTVVLFVLRGRNFGISWVGDSRAYLLRDRRLYRLTKDHSQVQEMIDHGLLDAAAAATHPMRNLLTRAVGVLPSLMIDTVTDVLEPDDLVVLCSDGLYGVIGEAAMEAILASEPIERASQTMVDRCHALGAPDNITIVAVSAAEVTLIQIGNSDRDD